MKTQTWINVGFIISILWMFFQTHSNFELLKRLEMQMVVEEKGPCYFFREIKNWTGVKFLNEDNNNSVTSLIMGGFLVCAK